MKVNKELPSIKLQPLRIPSSWIVSFNAFTELDPKTLLLEDTRWLCFTQDLLQIKHSRYNIIIDLGWTPDTEPEGNYIIKVIKDHDWDNPIADFTSDNKESTVGYIEKLLWELA